MEKIYYVYELRDLNNIVIDAGETTRPKIRLYQHTKVNPNKGSGLGKHYGKELTMHIIKEFTNRKDALELEGQLKLQHGIEWTERTRGLMGNIHNKSNGGTKAQSKTKECPHCNKTIKGMIYGRWHGDKCKYKV